MQRWVLLLFAILGAGAISPLVLFAQDDSTSASEFRRADAELNRLYQQVLPHLAPTARERLREAQRAWLAFTKANDLVLKAAPRTQSNTWMLVETQARCEQLRYLLGNNTKAVSGADDADADLNATYKEIIATLPSSAEAALRQVQRTWVTFYDASRDESAALAAMIARQRAEQLRAHYLGEARDVSSEAADDATASEAELPADPTIPDPFERARRPR